MDYQQSLDYLMRFADYERLPRSGIVWDLRRVERLLERLGNPQLAVKTVHLAGTKGKGSTAAMAEAILRRAGYRTGLYTSPHLLSFTERIRVNGQPVAEEEWVRLVETMQPEVAAVNAAGVYGELTTFEIYTAMAFTGFRDNQVDYQVIEVGLGGRLDATNVVRPIVCVMTSISYDHTDVLGDTLDEIAGEKAGIIKPGAVVVSAPQPPEAMAVIEKVSRDKGVRLVRAGVDFNWERTGFTGTGQTGSVRGLSGEYDLELPLLGEYQLENAALAVAAAELLAPKGADRITPESIVAGLGSVSAPGRLQVLRRHPWLVVDEAHNAYSMRRLGEALREHFKYDKLILILGFGSDKDVEGMINEAAGIADEIILTATRHPKAVRPEALAERFAADDIKTRTAPNAPAAIRLALSSAGKDDLICALGSVFLVAEVLEEEI